MRWMRVVLAAAFFLQLGGCFFIFIPGSVVSAATDAVTGASGSNCVGNTAKVGDKVRMPDGKMLEVKSLSGTSTRCQDPLLPIRAELIAAADNGPPPQRLPEDPSLSAVQVTLPDGWVSRPLTPGQAESGARMSAGNEAMGTSVLVYVYSTKTVPDPKTFAESQRVRLKNALAGGLADVVAQTSYNGLDVFRCTVTGRSGSESVAEVMTLVSGPNGVVELVTFSRLSNLATVTDRINALVASISGLR